MANENDPTYSVSVRLQRTTAEYAFVSVFLTTDLWVLEPDGKGHVNGAKVMQRAVEMGLGSEVVWLPEGARVELHPIQMAPPELADAPEWNPGEPGAP